MANNLPKVLPKLVVFDLDYTLWPFWVDTHVTPPFRKKGSNITDARGQKIECYKDVADIFTLLRSNDVKIGVASRTSEIQAADQLVDLFDWGQHVHGRQIYPGSKIPHFTRFHRNSGISFQEMLFFDDEYRNIKDVSSLGVTCIHADNGISMAVFMEGLQQYAQNKKS